MASGVKNRKPAAADTTNGNSPSKAPPSAADIASLRRAKSPSKLLGRTNIAISVLLGLAVLAGVGMIAWSWYGQDVVGKAKTPKKGKTASTVESEEKRRAAAAQDVDESPFYNTTIPFPVPPDVRPKSCAAKVPRYQHGDLTVSIVIPFLREKYEYIKGTVGSVLAYTPKKHLKEIIFISDGNTDAEAYEEEITGLSKIIRMIRLPHRHGLIYAKELGARESQGEVVMFFEPHCIVGVNWLEPLLHQLIKKPNALALPTLDYIPQENFHGYMTAALGRYRFEWNFNLIYTNPPSPVDEQYSKPYPAPATSGGIFAIMKERFLDLNLFDVGMKQWGGDQIELSFKAWRCGGEILVVPCARVGHLFRDVAHRP